MGRIFLTLLLLFSLSFKDKIFIFNNLNSKDKNNPKGKFMIIEIEIVK